MCAKGSHISRRHITQSRFLLNFSNYPGLSWDNGETLFSMSLYQCEPSLRQQGASGFTHLPHIIIISALP